MELDVVDAGLGAPDREGHPLAGLDHLFDVEPVRMQRVVVVARDGHGQ